MVFVPVMGGWFNLCKLINVTHVNKSKYKDILSIDADKRLDKIYHLPLIKIYSKSGMLGSFWHEDQGLDMAADSLLLFKTVLEVLASAINQGEKNKGMQIGKGSQVIPGCTWCNSPDWGNKSLLRGHCTHNKVP